MPWYKIDVDLHQRHIAAVKVAGKNLCIVKDHTGQLYVSQRRCPHAGGDLSAGWCKGGKLICPLHRYGYDLSSGRGNQGQGDYITVYPVKTEAESIFIYVESFWNKLKRLFT